MDWKQQTNVTWAMVTVLLSPLDGKYCEVIKRTNASGESGAKMLLQEKRFPKKEILAIWLTATAGGPSIRPDRKQEKIKKKSYVIWKKLVWVVSHECSCCWRFGKVLITLSLSCLRGSDSGCYEQWKSQLTEGRSVQWSRVGLYKWLSEFHRSAEGGGGWEGDGVGTSNVSLNQNRSTPSCWIYWSSTWDVRTISLLAELTSYLGGISHLFGKGSWTETKCSVCPIGWDSEWQCLGWVCWMMWPDFLVQRTGQIVHLSLHTFPHVPWLSHLLGVVWSEEWGWSPHRAKPLIFTTALWG